MKRLILMMVLGCLLTSATTHIHAQHHHHDHRCPPPPPPTRVVYHPVYYPSGYYYPTTTYVVHTTPRQYISNHAIAQLTTMASNGQISTEEYSNRILLASKMVYQESVTGWVFFTAGMMTLACSPIPLVANNKTTGTNACFGMMIAGTAVSLISLIPIFDAESKKYDLRLSLRATGVSITF